MRCRREATTRAALSCRSASSTCGSGASPNCSFKLALKRPPADDSIADKLPRAYERAHQSLCSSLRSVAMNLARQAPIYSTQSEFCSPSIHGCRPICRDSPPFRSCLPSLPEPTPVLREAILLQRCFLWQLRSDRAAHHQVGCTHQHVAGCLVAGTTDSAAGSSYAVAARKIIQPSTSFSTGRPCQRSGSCRITRFFRSPPISSFSLSSDLICSHTLPVALFNGT